MAVCVLCLHPIRRRWWHRILPPLPVHVGAEAAACCERLDQHARRARTA